MSKKNLTFKQKKLLQEWFRIFVQIGFFILTPSVYSASFNAVKNTFTAIGAGLPLELSGFSIQFIIVIVYTILFGRFFCGWACAFGTINDWVYRFSSWIQRKTKKKIPPIPEKEKGILSFMKYLVLIGLLTLCFRQQGKLITPNSPWTIFSLIRARHLTLSGNMIGIILLILLLVGMFFQERFFCRFFCPMGAILSILPNMPFLRLKRKSTTCPERCGACKKTCPVDLLIEENSLNIGECIRCGRCSGICPKKNITTMGKLRGNEWWLDLLKAFVLITMILHFQK